MISVNCSVHCQGKYVYPCPGHSRSAFFSSPQPVSRKPPWSGLPPAPHLSSVHFFISYSITDIYRRFGAGLLMHGTGEVAAVFAHSYVIGLVLH